MKTLLIDNGSTLTKKLALLSPGEEEIVSYDNIPNDISNYSLILLSGSSTTPVLGNEHVFAKELNMIQNTKAPIVGVCLGHELIARAFGATLTHFTTQHVGMTEVTVLENHPMFMETKSFPVYENHQYGVTEVSDELVPLAKTDHAIAVLKHKTRDLYGLQFHPEHHTDQQFGDDVFLSLFAQLVREQKASSPTNTEPL